jgi:glycosyltransferase involved in cell wall biosynthesis
VRPAQPIPIAIVLSRFVPGGTERQTIELIRRLDRGRWTVHLASFRNNDAWFDRAAETAASVGIFPVTSFHRLSAASHLAQFSRWCRAREVAIVHTTEMPSNIFGLPGAALARIPVRIGSRREVSAGRTAVQLAMQRAAYGFAHRIVANSRAAAERLLVERIPQRKIRIVSNGVEIERFERRTARSVLRKIVVVANLRPEKGHDAVIDAAGDVLARFPDVHFELVGDGPERGALQARADSRGVAHAFAFLDHQDNVAARLAAADIFVLPSRSESLPNALLEAMAAGLPIVASAVGGILELLEDGRTGLLVPSGNPKALANALCTLMENPAEAARLGEAAAADARNRFPFDRMVAAFERVYLDELIRRGITAANAPQLAASSEWMADAARR